MYHDFKYWDDLDFVFVSSKNNPSQLQKLTITLILYVLVSAGCRKDKAIESCGCKGPKTEIIDKIFGIIVETDDGFQILTDEKGLLLPCSELSGNFKKDAQPVIISGALKTPCKKIPYEFNITPIEISQIMLRDSTYDKTDISLSIIKSEDYGYNPGFGYFITDHRSPVEFKIIQPHIPAISGLTTFDSPDHARKTAMLVIYLMRKNQGLLSLSIEILKYLNIIN